MLATDCNNKSYMEIFKYVDGQGSARGQGYLIKIFYFNLKRTENTKKGKLCQAGNERKQKKAEKIFPK
jgi:hypothetical protein